MFECVRYLSIHSTCPAFIFTFPCRTEEQGRGEVSTISNAGVGPISYKEYVLSVCNEGKYPVHFGRARSVKPQLGAQLVCLFCCRFLARSCFLESLETNDGGVHHSTARSATHRRTATRPHQVDEQPDRAHDQAFVQRPPDNGALHADL